VQVPTVTLVRSYQPDDRDRLLEIWLKASRVGHGFLTEEDLARQSEIVRDTYLPTAENWVARRNGRVLGFIGLLDSYIGGLFVDPAAHGSGLGRALIDHAAAIRETLDVEVYSANEGALAFYGRCGFVETGRKPQDGEGRPLEVICLTR